MPPAPPRPGRSGAGGGSVVIPAQLQHQLVVGAGELAEVARGGQAQAEVARHFPLLVERQAAAYLAVVEVVAAGFQAQPAEGVVPQQAAVEAQGRRQVGGEVAVVLDARGGQGIGQGALAERPATTGATAQVADQGLFAVPARYPLQAAAEDRKSVV